MKLGVPVLSYAEIRVIADNFMRGYPKRAGIPVDIEGLIDNDLRLDVVPVPGLRLLCGADAYLWSNLRRISVDEVVYNSYENRYRFSLAHELAHVVLHGELYSSVEIADADAYRRFQWELDPRDWERMEDQANNFAGLVLVPSAELARRFQQAKLRAEARGIALERNWEAAVQYISASLGKQFGVAPKTAEIRLRKDYLIP